MIFMQKEMQNDFKKDVKEGKIFGLRLIKTSNEVIRKNINAEIFETVREITGFDEEKFYLRTRLREPHFLKGTFNGSDYAIPDYSIPSFKYQDCEGYFSAFDFYDGNILRSSQSFPAVVDQDNSVSITEYEVLWSY